MSPSRIRTVFCPSGCNPATEVIHRLSLACLVLLLAAGEGAAAEPSPLLKLSWLAGCWAAESAEAGTVEHWLAPAGGTMFGVARTVRGGRTVEYEFMQIRLDTDGKVVYIASPSGQQQATFTATVVNERTVTFENPAHDFPQRIIYRALPGDRLAARIEGMQGGAMRGIDYPMKRVRCD